MSSPRNIWWSYAKAIIRSYPSLVAMDRDNHAQRVTAVYDGMPKAKGTAGRSLENTALRQLPPCQQRELDAVRAAIAKTKQIPTGPDRLKLIDLVYWRQSHTISGAAYCLHIHDQTAKNWHRAFVYEVGRAMGFLDGLE